MREFEIILFQIQSLSIKIKKYSNSKFIDKNVLPFTKRLWIVVDFYLLLYTWQNYYNLIG
jgi:hypothetical protein